MKLGMVVDVYVTFEKILGGNFLKSKWPPKSKMAAIIYSFSKNCCSGCVYHKTIHKIGIIAHIYIELQTRMIHKQIELQNGRQNSRWPPQKLGNFAHLYIYSVYIHVYQHSHWINKSYMTNTIQDGRHKIYLTDILQKTTYLVISKTCKIRFLFDY